MSATSPTTISTVETVPGSRMGDPSQSIPAPPSNTADQKISKAATQSFSKPSALTAMLTSGGVDWDLIAGSQQEDGGAPPVSPTSPTSKKGDAVARLRLERPSSANYQVRWSRRGSGTKMTRQNTDAGPTSPLASRAKESFFEKVATEDTAAEDETH